jgi:diguanylate cyclase (GGDEF)-like protein
MEEAMRVLIGEDDTPVRRVLETALTEWGYDPSSCTDGPAALQALVSSSPPFDYALLDWSLPDLNGLSICQAIRQRGLSHTYTILLVPPEAKESLLACLEAGADDYICTPADAQQMRLRLRAGERVLELRRALADAQEQLRIKTTQDRVTGLWNREALLESLDRELIRSRREGAPLGLVLLDVDDFRLVNDTFGRQAGDSALHQVGQRLRRSLRPYDAVGRYVGNQFLILLPGCDAQTAGNLAERLRTSVSAHPFKLEEGTVRITVSAGVTAAGSLEEMRGADALLRAVEAALCKAKQPGQNSLAMAAKGAWLNLAT